MQLTGTYAQSPREVREEGVLHLLFSASGGHFLFGVPRGYETVLQITLQVIEGEGPAVTLVRHVATQQGEGNRSDVGSHQLDSSGERWGVLEVDHLGQVAPDLQIWARPLVEAPVGFQGEFLTENDGMAALLRLGAANAQGRC